MDNLKSIVVGQVKSLRPSLFTKRPHFNFITAHYFWIISLSILGSVLLFASAGGQLPFIDALVFAVGANTQAGLNTVDVNLLNTSQQVILYFLAMLANPITINSFVVWLRLYWFEKRFQHVVREARSRRGTVSKSKPKATSDQDMSERGVAGRNITVMHNNNTNARMTNDGILLDPADDGGPGKDALGLNQGSISEKSPDAIPGERNPEIRFAPTVKRSDGLDNEATKLPPTRSDEEHIAILERQRNIDDEVLRIPGPRDAERGILPKRVQHGGSDDDVDPLSPAAREDTRDTDVASQPENEARAQRITIEEPDRQKREESLESDMVDNARAFRNTLSVLRLRKPRFMNKKDQKLHHEEDNIHVHQTQPRRRQTFETFRTALSSNQDQGTPYLSWEPTLGRNSQFPDLSEEQREELGGIEYRSLKTLALILTFYFWGFSAFGVACLLPWIIRSSTYGPLVDAAGQSRTWWGFFTPNSAFMDLGFTLTPDSMNSFNTGVFPLLIMSFLIVIGNTGFPIMLRFMIWVISLFTPKTTGLWEELRFLLDHPRRCFTLLFPSGATWWLFWLLVILNGIDLIFFIILDLGSGPVSDLPGGIRVLDGLFQAASTRTAGFSCINLGLLHPGVQTSYMIMMYISVFPIAISVRRTNVYEEKSLGVYSKSEDEEQANANDLSYVGAHLRRQLSFDLWYIFVGFFILTISEGSRLMSNDISMFAVLFEIVSAYGTVGLSLGYANVNASLCSQFSVVGKLVIAAMMIRGRHRGLPYGLDRAILLPSESLNAKEAADADSRLARRTSQYSVASQGRDTSTRRGRSKSIDRVNSNILTSFLHPGPHIHKSNSVFGQPRRSMEDAGSEDESPYSSRLTPRRSETTALATPTAVPRLSNDDNRPLSAS